MGGNLLGQLLGSETLQPGGELSAESVALRASRVSLAIQLAAGTAGLEAVPCGRHSSLVTAFNPQGWS